MVPFGMNKIVALSNIDGNENRSSNMHLCYMIFDLIWVKLDNEEINLMKFTLEERKRILNNTVK